MKFRVRITLRGQYRAEKSVWYWPFWCSVYDDHDGWDSCSARTYETEAEAKADIEAFCKEQKRLHAAAKHLASVKPKYYTCADFS